MAPRTLLPLLLATLTLCACAGSDDGRKAPSGLAPETRTILGGVTSAMPENRDPISSVAALDLVHDSGTGAKNIADLVKSLTEAHARGELTQGVDFPLGNGSGDELRALQALRPSVVVSWLDPLGKEEDGGEADRIRFGANCDYIAWFGAGWNDDWRNDVVGGAPQYRGSGQEGFLWVNHEYVSGEPPTLTSAPTDQHLTLARFLKAMGQLSNDVESSTWKQADIETFMKHSKRQLGGSWLRLQRDRNGWTTLADDPRNRRYDGSDSTLLALTGFELQRPARDDEGKPLPKNVVVGLQADCSGLQTPWGTIISAEENVQDYYGDLECCWSADQQFIRGRGFDPGGPITPPYPGSMSGYFGSTKDMAGTKDRDGYGFLAEVDPGADADDVYESAARGGDGRGHRKIGAMGRAHWENAACVVGRDFALLPGQPIVLYSGNDRNSGHVYKFVSAGHYERGMTRARVRALLDEGTLYVADFQGLDHRNGRKLVTTGQAPSERLPGQGRWIELSIDSQDIAPNAAALGDATKTVGAALRDLKWNSIGGFRNQNDVLMATFTANLKIGVPELNRPEDLEWNPFTKQIFVAFTNHKRRVANDQNGLLFDPDEQGTKSPLRKDKVGAVFAIEEANADQPAKSKTFLYHEVWGGSLGQGLFDASCPDNILIDREGGVWFGTDGNFATNGSADGFYYLDLDPAHAEGMPGIVNPTYGKALRIAAVPSNAESTGPCFNSDMTTLFISVQHPGEGDEPSTWPHERY